MQRQCIASIQMSCRSSSRSLPHLSELELTRIVVYIVACCHVPGSSSLNRIPPLHALSLIGTEALMEILGLVPSQSETQYLQLKLGAIAERPQSINKLPLCDGSVAAFFDPSHSRGNNAATCCRNKIIHVQRSHGLR